MKRIRLGELDGAWPATAATESRNVGIGALRAKWVALTGGVAQTPFQSFDWNDLWLLHRGNGAEPFILTLCDGAVIAPFEKVRRGGVRLLRLLGTGDSDYNGVVTSGPAAQAWDAIVQQLVRRRGEWDLLHLHSVAEGDMIRQALCRHHGFSVYGRLYETCPRVGTERPWESLLANRKKLRYEVKRWERRLRDLGEISIQNLAPPISGELIQELVEVEQASWKWTLGEAGFQPGSQRYFLEAILKSREAPVRLWLLRIGPRLVAFAILLVSRAGWYYYLPSFRQDYPHAGSYLLARIIQEACQSDCQFVDLLRGQHGYKLDWADQSIPVYEIVCSGSWRGYVAALGYRARWRAASSRLLKELRAGLVRGGDRRGAFSRMHKAQSR